MKLTLMLMGGSAFLLLGILGIYYHSAPEGGQLTMNLLEISANGAIPHGWQTIPLPDYIRRFRCARRDVPVPHMGPDGHASAPTAVSMLHAGVLMKLGGYGCFRVAIYLMPQAVMSWHGFFLILTGISVVYGAFSACVQTDLRIYQRLLFGKPLRHGALRHPHAQHHRHDRRRAPDALARSDDSPLLRPYRYDLRTYIPATSV